MAQFWYVDGASAIAFLRILLRRVAPILLLLLGMLGSAVWLVGSRNPHTPAGHGAPPR